MAGAKNMAQTACEITPTYSRYIAGEINLAVGRIWFDNIVISTHNVDSNRQLRSDAILNIVIKDWFRCYATTIHQRAPYTYCYKT